MTAALISRRAPGRRLETRRVRAAASLAGPGLLVAVGYVDPGNWATDLAAGSHYAYDLLWVVVAASVVAILFQITSARLGIATSSDLAAATRSAYPTASWVVWADAELAVIATDLAEVLGSALALRLLFGMPIAIGVVVTAADVALLALGDGGPSSPLGKTIAGMLFVVAAGLAYELVLSRPHWSSVVRGLVPDGRIARDPRMLLSAVGIVGATVMPHNLYLHSRLVVDERMRIGEASEAARDPLPALRAAYVDTVLSLGGAMLVNVWIVVIAAAVFHAHGHQEPIDIADAHRLLQPLLGSRLAPVVFAVALLAAGQSATLTGTLAGQAIMSGLLNLRWSVRKRRLVTRACAVVPALAIVLWAGEASAGPLLLVSQVVLSLQLPFALIPLLLLTSDRRRMGRLANPTWLSLLAWLSTAIICAGNGLLLATILAGRSSGP